MRRRGLPCVCGVFVLGFILAILLWPEAPTHGQDSITNLDQLTATFDLPGLDCPLAMPYEPDWLQPMDILFLDFATLTNAVAAITNYPAQTQNDVPVWVLRLIQDAETGEVVLKPSGVDVELLRIDTPTNFAPFDAYNRVLRSYCLEILAENPTSYEDLLAEGHTMLDPAQLVIDVFVVRAEDEEAYCANSAASTTTFTAMAEDSGGMMLMDDLSCTITDEAPFTVQSVVADTNGANVTWSSCSDHVYGVFSTDALTGTDTVWVGVTAMWGDDGETSWVDTNVTSDVTNRFYKIVRIPPDQGYNGDAIPSGWAVDHGLNPLDPNLDSENPDGDAFDNLHEYIADTDPLNSSSYFHVIDVLVVGSDIRVFFTSASDRYYNLQRSPFVFGPYSNVVQNIPGNSGIQWAKDIGAASLGYWYRVSVFIATNIPPDSDSDGMPDLWTEKYFGHPTGLAADLSRATDNPDGDCFTNLQEYQTGTDPTNSDFKVAVSGTATTCVAQTVYLFAPSIPGATYNWTGPNGFNSTNQNPSLPNATTNATGVYCVAVTSNGCTSTSNCAPVTVSAPPTATVSGTTTNTCPGVLTVIQAALTGTGPWILSWSDGVIATNSSALATRVVAPYLTTTYTITAVSDAICSSGTVSGGAAITVSTNVPTSVVVVSNEVLVVYNSNTNFPDSLACKNYYISHRPGFSNANVLACSCTTTGVDGFEKITTANLTNQIINPIIDFIQSNPAKSIHYVVLMYGMPSRIDDGCGGCMGPPTVQHHISRCMSDAGYTSGPYYEGLTCPFVATNYLGTTCLVTALNMATLADCTAYVDKVTGMYSDNVIISARAAGYTNQTYYLDNTTYDPTFAGSSVMDPFRSAILSENPSASVAYSSSAIITTGTDIKGYVGWGIHNFVFYGTYATDGSVAWSGRSKWWLIETFESYNGMRDCGQSAYHPQDQGCVAHWFASNAWGGTNYNNTPVGAVSHVEEPGLPGVNDSTYLGLWEAGYLFSECAWASKKTAVFQAIGDPLIKQ